MRRFATACTAAVLALGVTGACRAARAADKVERTWAAKCASCHGETGKGDTTKGKEMGVKDYTTPAWQKAITDEKIKAGIENGASSTVGDKKFTMEGYKDKLKPDVVDGLVKYIRAFK